VSKALPSAATARYHGTARGARKGFQARHLAQRAASKTTAAACAVEARNAPIVRSEPFATRAPCNTRRCGTKQAFALVDLALAGKQIVLWRPASALERCLAPHILKEPMLQLRNARLRRSELREKRDIQAATSSAPRAQLACLELHRDSG